MNTEGTIKCRCRHYDTSLPKIRNVCVFDSKFIDVTCNYLTCTRETYVSWTSYILYKEHLVEVKNE